MKSANKILNKSFLDPKSAAKYLLETAQHYNQQYQNNSHLEQTYSKFKDSFYREQSNNPGLLIFKSFLDSKYLYSMNLGEYRKRENFLTKETQYDKRLASIAASVSFHEKTGFFPGGYLPHEGMMVFHLENDSEDFYKITSSLKVDREDMEAQKLLHDLRASVSRIHSFWDHDASTTIQTIQKEDGSKKMVVMPYEMGPGNFQQCPYSRNVGTDRIIKDVGGFRSYNECAFKPRYDTFAMPVFWLNDQTKALPSSFNTSIDTVKHLSEIYGYYVKPLILIDKKRKEKNELFEIGNPEINKHGIAQNITDKLEEECKKIEENYIKTPSSIIKTNGSSYSLTTSSSPERI